MFFSNSNCIFPPSIKQIVACECVRLKCPWISNKWLRNFDGCVSEPEKQTSIRFWDTSSPFPSCIRACMHACFDLLFPVLIRQQRCQRCWEEMLEISCFEFECDWRSWCLMWRKSVFSNIFRGRTRVLEAPFCVLTAIKIYIYLICYLEIL